MCFLYYVKNWWITQVNKDFLLCFLRSFIVLCFTCSFVVHFDFIFYMVWDMDQILLIFCIWVSNYYRLNCWKHYVFFYNLSLHLCLQSVVYICIFVWVYFWTLYSVPLWYISIIVPTPHFLDCCCFIISLEIKQYKPNFILLFKNSFGYCSPFLFAYEFYLHMNVRIILSISIKVFSEILIGIVLNLNLGEIDILTILSVCFHLFHYVINFSL